MSKLNSSGSSIKKSRSLSRPSRFPNCSSINASLNACGKATTEIPVGNWLIKLLSRLLTTMSLSSSSTSDTVGKRVTFLPASTVISSTPAFSSAPISIVSLPLFALTSISSMLVASTIDPSLSSDRIWATFTLFEADAETARSSLFLVPLTTRMFLPEPPDILTDVSSAIVQRRVSERRLVSSSISVL